MRPCPHPSAMETPKVLWQRRGVTDGGFVVASPGHLVSLHNHSRRGPTGWRVGAHPLCVPFRRSWPHHHLRRGSSGWRHWRPPPLCVHPARSSHGRPNRWRRWCPSPPCHLSSATAGLAGHTSASGHSLSSTWLDAGKSRYRTRKLHNTMRGKPTYPIPVFPLPLLVLSPLVGPLCPSLPVCCAPALSARARTVYSNLRGTLVSLLLPLWLLSVPPCVPVLSLHPLPLLVRAGCRAMCEALLFLSLRLSRLLPPLGPLYRSCPLLPPRPSYPRWLCSAPPLGAIHVNMLYTLHDTYLPTRCIHPRHFRASHALPAACTALAGFPATGGLAARGTPSRGCSRGILPPAFRLMSHLRVTAPAYAGHT